MEKLQLLSQQAYIDGQWVDAISKKTTTIYNPATGTAIGTVPFMAQTEAQLAIKAAEQALPIWRAKTAKERSNLLYKWYELITAHQEELAYIMTIEQGKPLAEARGEITYAASFVQWFAEEAKRIYGDVIPGPQTNKRILVMKQAIGVVAAITPWNFPSSMITRKAAPALAAGCTMVLKPAPQTPYSALALAKLAEEAGIPKGVFNVVTGDAIAIGNEMCRNPIVRKLSFTGSTKVGRILLEQCAHDIKKVSLELGGNAPFIVFDDADIDAAVQGAIASKFRNNGQTCVCSNRLYIHNSIHNQFVEKLVQEVQKFKVGNGLDKGTSMGPLIDEHAVNKVSTHIQDALSKGAQLIIGGKKHLLGGTFFEPTILTNVPQTAIVAQEETFGPLAPIFTFTDEEQVIADANNTQYGLAAYFYSRDIRRIFRVAEALEYGMVGINSGLISNEMAPFGGVKSSGLGREGSKYGIEEYVEIKYLSLDI